MAAGNVFQPGDRVRVILGNWAGARGEVVSILDASVLWMHGGPAAASFQPLPGQVCVAITSSGASIPIAVDPTHLIPDDPDPANPTR
jgi:transcription antitermination factor NusG